MIAKPKAVMPNLKAKVEEHAIVAVDQEELKKALAFGGVPRRVMHQAQLPWGADR